MRSIYYRNNPLASLFLIMFVLVANAAQPLRSETIRLAVASNFLKASKALAAEFEVSSQHKIAISSGSSGKLYHQIVNGAPFDVFLSADSHKPQQLIEAKLAVADSLTTYARGRLSLWIKNCDAKSQISDLANPQFGKIAVANPRLAPYGIATQALLENLDLWQVLKTKLVFPENIAQVSQLVKLGVVDAAFVAHSQVVNSIQFIDPKSAACIVEISDTLYPAIDQQLVLVAKSRHIKVAREFIEFVKSEQGQILIKNMGYLVD